jgi:lysophospholipase L1-like esterase
MGNYRKVLKYLALGDSYTVGEGIDPKDNFPNLLINQLKDKGIPIKLEKLIAKTGWTTGELLKEMGQKSWLEGESFDLITLLIGVNNQYRGKPPQAYAEDFAQIADKCLELVKGKAERVFVISIPDWGVTPFAKEKDTNLTLTAQSIDTFNDINRGIAANKGFHYLDITEDYRERGGLPGCLASDQLHPSATIYHHWAKLLAERLVGKL